MIFNEQSLKKDLSLRQMKNCYFLFGNDPMLTETYSRRITNMFQANETVQVEKYDGHSLDFSRLCEEMQLFPMLGGKRLFFIKNFDPETLSERETKDLTALLEDIEEFSVLLICAKQGTVDLKKGVRAKRILPVVEQIGIAACLDHPTRSQLSDFLRTRCQKRGISLSADAAAFFIDRCGEDLHTLTNECDKLIAACTQEKPEIDKSLIRSLSTPFVEGDIYVIAKMMLKGTAQPVLTEIDCLLNQRQPAALILSSLGAAFSDYYRASIAHLANKSIGETTKDLGYRFEWKVKNAFRDSQQTDSLRLLKVCSILCEAETRLKTQSVHERALLDATVIQCISILKGAA